jgi:DnaJ domain
MFRKRINQKLLTADKRITAGLADRGLIRLAEIVRSMCAQGESMENQFKVKRGSCSITKGAHETVPEPDLNHPRPAWQFVEEFQRLLGEECEPDPLFFVESWTMGISAAVETFQHRRQGEADRDRENHAFQQFENLETQVFIPENRQDAGQFHSARNVGMPPRPHDRTRTLTQFAAPQESETFVDDYESSQDRFLPMTQLRAYRLLGVTAASTQRQIKFAYRQLVSQWHPDRLECMSEDVRHLATQRMAAINEAYHLLHSDLGKSVGST